MAPRVLICAGEASGDAHAAALVRALKALRPELSFYGLGGPRMAGAGVELLAESSQVAVTGFVELLPLAGRIIRTLNRLKKAIREDRPRALILIDFPDFNLRLARTARRAGIRVVYYIPPQVWAWRRGRVRILAECCDRLICIFPFEEEFYRRHGVEAEFVGHPFVDLPSPGPAEGQELLQGLGLDPSGEVLALLPGSRTNEVRRVLPALAEAGERLRRLRPGLRVLLPVAPGLSPESLGPLLGGAEVSLTEAPARRVLAAARAALVCSGTATLEAALAGTPLVVVYKASLLSYLIGRALIRQVRHIAMPNLIAGREVVPEYIQGRLKPAALVEAALPLLDGGETRERMLAQLALIRESLGRPGAVRRAAERAAEILGED